MLGYLNGLGRSKNTGSTTKKNILKKALALYPPAIAIKLAKKAMEKNRNGSTNRTVTKKKTLLKKAFSVLPPVMAVKLAKQVIERNKSLPRSASQNTQFRALKHAVAKNKADKFLKSNNNLFLEATEMNSTPVAEQEIEDAQIEQEVENEMEMEQEFSDDQADLGIYYPTSIGDKATRKAKKEAKIDKTKAKAQLKRDKGQAKKDRATRPKASFKDVSSSILDTVKQGAGIYKDLKGGGSGSESGSGDESLPSQDRTGQNFFAKNKTLLIVGGVALLGGAFLLMRNKGKGK